MQAFARGSGKSKHDSQLATKRKALCYERLEDRRMLANIAAVDAYLVDRTGTNPLAEVVVGQKIGVRLDWSTDDLPSAIANYQVEFRVDGVPLRSDDDNFGAGQLSRSFWWYRTGWYASPGAHTVEVIVDVDNEVVESNESDNTITFEFTPVTASFPQLMTWPLELEPLTEAFWSNYNDVDPTSGLSDFQGRNATYNTHNAIDSRLVTFSVQDQGVEIYAALDGVVKSINDGEFDRQTAFNSSPSNSVVIDHGNGWETLYLHFRRDSVQVEVGQTVSQGDILGLVGSSGSSTAPHIHFELRRDGLPVETYYDPTTYWESPVDYVFDNVYLVHAGITNYNPGGQHFWEGPSDSQVLGQQSNIGLYARGYYSGLEFNDLVQSLWYLPNGSLYASRSFNVNSDYSRSGWFWTNDVNLPTVPDLGTWRVEYRVNGEILGNEFFEVTTNGEPEIRIEEPNGDIVTDGRFTPFDYGTVNIGSTRPTQKFTIINHGYDTLTIDSLEVPTGYTVVDGLPDSLAPGVSDTLTVALDTTAGGYFSGEIRIATNDTDEPIYNFAVEGIVTSGGVENLIVGIGEFTVSEGSQMVANIRRTGSTSAAATVTLASDDTTAISLPNTVNFLPGEDYAQFFFNAPDNMTLDGNHRATIIASASGYYSGSKSIDVIDDEQQIGDFTGDGSVNGADFLAWQRGVSPNPSSTSDLNEWQANYGNSIPTANIATPEIPATASHRHNTVTFPGLNSFSPTLNSIASDSHGSPQDAAEVTDQAIELMAGDNPFRELLTVPDAQPSTLAASVEEELKFAIESLEQSRDTYDLDILFAGLEHAEKYGSLFGL